jgi:hypothetical protein
VKLARCAVAVVVAAQARPADAACDPAEAAELREHLTSQGKSADRWNLAWRITFTGAAVTTFAVGLANPLPSLQTGLYASAGKATIGAVARWFFTLRVHVPPADPDPCVDLAALRTELRRVARKERSLFWMSHIGGTAVNLGGAAYVYLVEDSVGKALLSIAIGYPVGVLSNYTMPRGSWKKYRDSSFTPTTVLVAPRDDGWVLTFGGAF